MRSAFVFLLAFCGVATAQTLATNDDGSIVLLNSAWRLRAGTAAGTSVFRSLDSGNTWEALASPGENSDAYSPFVTGDGGTFAWERGTRCFGSCMIALPRSRTEFTGLSGEVRINPYMLRVSHNGRWVLTPGFFGLTEYELQNLESNATYSPSRGAPLLAALSPPADDGTFIGLVAARADQAITTPVDPKRLVAWRPGWAQVRELMTGSDVYTVAVAADGSRAAVWTPTELLLFEVASGTVVRIAQASHGSQRWVALSNNGSRVLFSGENGRLWMWEQGAPARPVASVREPSSGSAISGDGRTAWVMTASGSLTRVSLDEDRAEVVFSGVPLQMGQITYGTVPGSAVMFHVFGDVQTTGLVAEAAGKRLPFLDTSDPETVAVQVPWDMPAASRDGSPTPMKVSHPNSPFFLQQDLYIFGKVQPAFINQSYANGRNYIKAAKGDFGSLVTSETPALAGETIHVYLFGLGPLDRDVPTGVPGPSDPAAHPTAPLACYLSGLDRNPPARGLVLPFVAYAPGLVGVYQVDMTIPDDWPEGDAYVFCQSDPAAGASGVLPITRRAVPPAASDPAHGR